MTIEILNNLFLKNKPKLVMIDLDNCLYDYNIAHGMAISEVEVKFIKSLGITEDIFKETFEKSKKIIKDRLGETASSHSRLLYFQNMIELLCFKTDPSLSLDLEQTYWRAFLGAAKLFQGVEDFLIKLRSLDINVILITDLTTQIQFRKLIYFGIDRYFDYVIASEEAGTDKKGLKPYQLVESKIQLKQDDIIWMIGDSISDMKYSKQVFHKIFTLQKIHLNCNNIFPESDVVFSEFKSLIKELGKIHAD